jgi:mono/diheme cytochrome c family protein
MRRVAKWLGYGLGAPLVLALGLLGWVEGTWSVDHPDTPFPSIAATTDPEVIARGEYLVHAVAHCSTCHSPADQVAAHSFDFTSPQEGGNVWNVPPFGVFTAANLTPDATGIGRWSDAQVARVIRTGIGPGGKLSPVMRMAVGPMSDEDLTAIVSWLRAQEPVAGERAPTEYGILAKALSKRFLPRLDPPPIHVPGGEVSVERGRYLAEGPAFCFGCHSPTDPMNGFAIKGAPFSGSDPEPDSHDPGFEIVAPNLTPHPTAGHITGWDEEQFVARFRAGRIYSGSTMPWEGFGRMTEEDVRSIYRYLRMLEPVDRNVGPTRRSKGSFKG